VPVGLSWRVAEESAWNGRVVVGKPLDLSARGKELLLRVNGYGYEGGRETEFLILPLRGAFYSIVGGWSDTHEDVGSIFTAHPDVFSGAT